VLPDGLTDTWGHVRSEAEAQQLAALQQQQRAGQGPALPKQPVLLVNNERFMVPEALFHPSGTQRSLHTGMPAPLQHCLPATACLPLPPPPPLTI
jgi:actin-related protein 6